MRDLSEIGIDSLFAEAINEFFYDYKPETIIETGLYHGKGSTSLIASLIRGMKMEETEFYSIECNPKNIEIAKANLVESRLIDYVEICEGLSIPETLLPSHGKICEEIRSAKNLGMFVDHEVESSDYYKKETESFIEDDLLGKIINKLNGQIDFILLDSAGHIGNIEFNYVLHLIKSPCVIALDDINHLKHYKSLATIRKDPRFQVIHESEEKFGSALAIFHPL